jgi:hypothetical protein
MYLYERAKTLDLERANGSVRGPLHGIPILVKDNIGTVPGLGLPTTCGSLALVGAKPKKNTAIIDQVRYQSFHNFTNLSLRQLTSRCWRNTVGQGKSLGKHKQSSMVTHRSMLTLESGMGLVQVSARNYSL